MTAPRKFAMLFNPTSYNVLVKVSCECKARARNPPRCATIRCTNQSHEDCEESFTRRSRLLTIRTDQGDCTGPSPSSHHGASHLPWGPQLRKCFAHDAAPVLIFTTRRRLLLSIKTGTHCCRISDSQRYSWFAISSRNCH